MKTRRQFLQTATAATGGLLLSPVLAQIKAQAAGTKLPPRFVFVVEGNGLPPEQITPIGFKRGNVPVKVPNMNGVPHLVNESLVGKNFLNLFTRSSLGKTVSPLSMDYPDALPEVVTPITLEPSVLTIAMVESEIVVHLLERR